jgi:hypothetical protein
MKKAIIILIAILAIFVIATSIMLPSITQKYPFTKGLTVTLIQGNDTGYEPNYYYNITDNGKLVGKFFFRVEYIPPNGSSNQIYIDYEHLGGTKLDWIVFRFSSQEVHRVYLDMSDPVGVTYNPSRSTNTFAVKANFGELGTLQGSNTYQFVLYDDPSKTNNLFFTADISMHYMEPIQWTALSAQVTVNTIIPKA